MLLILMGTDQLSTESYENIWLNFEMKDVLLFGPVSLLPLSCSLDYVMEK